MKKSDGEGGTGRRPEAESAKGTAERNLMAWFKLHYCNGRVAAGPNRPVPSGTRGGVGPVAD